MLVHGLEAWKRFALNNHNNNLVTYCKTRWLTIIPCLASLVELSVPVLQFCSLQEEPFLTAENVEVARVCVEAFLPFFEIFTLMEDDCNDLVNSSHTPFEMLIYFM